MTAPITPNCPHCGAVLPAHAPAGLCPRCLMAMNLAEPTILSGDDTDSPPSAPPPAPEEIAHFFPTLDILECLGRGGMGVVYKARQKSLNRLVALKILAPERVKDPAFAQRFAVEAEALAKLNHPDIVTIHDFGQADGLFYFIMEFVDGVNLRQLLEVGRIAPREALAIVPQICDALQYAHDQGIIHRDIKPENILLDRRGRVKVADFGLAKLMGSSSPSDPSDPSDSSDPSDRSDPSDQGTRETVTTTEAGQVMGTPQYMAPEQRDHPTEVDHRADIYSLGVVFYQMLTGELPGRDLQPPSRKVLIDVRLDEVVLRALEQEPRHRYQQVSEVRTMVETIVSTPHASGESAAQVPASSSPAKVSPCYVSTPEHLRTFRGRFLSIYQGKGELRLDDQALVFLSGWQAVTIPLSSIRKLAQGDYPYSAKHVPLHYIAVTFAEHGVERTLLFTPVLKEVMSPWEANKVGAEWLTALQDAVRAGTGRVLAVERCDLAHDRFLVAKTALVAAPPFLVAFLISWLLVSQGLPRLSDLLTFVAVGVPTMVVVLMALRWRHRSVIASGNLDALAQEQGARATQPPRFSRAAIVGACWAALFLVMVLPVVGLHSVLGQYLPLKLLLLLVGTTAPFATTILGCVALSQIRRSAGQLRGLGLALFDALLFPLLALNGLIGFFWSWIVYDLIRASIIAADSPVSALTALFVKHPSEIVMLFTVPGALVLDYLIIRRAWRAVRQPAGGLTAIGADGPPNTVRLARSGIQDGLGQDARATGGAGILPATILSQSGPGSPKLTGLDGPPAVLPSNGPDAKAARLGKLALGLCLIGLVLPVAAAAFPMLTGTVDLVTVIVRMCIVALAVSALFGLPALILGILGWKSGAGKAAVIIAVVVPLLAVPTGVVLYPAVVRSPARAKADAEAGVSRMDPGKAEKLLHEMGIPTWSTYRQWHSTNGVVAVYLSQSNTTDDVFTLLKVFPRLRSFRMSSMGQIAESDLANLAYFADLEELALNCRVTDAVLGSIEGLKNLRYLDLSSSGVTDAGIERLKGLTQLEALNVSRTDVSPSGIAELQVALPGCRITAEGIRSKPRDEGASSPATFGPVIERVLNDLDEGHGNEALHLQTGTLSSIPAAAQKEWGVYGNWLKTNRMDLLADFARNRWSLLSIGLTLADFPAEKWDGATPADLNPALASGTTPERIERSGQVFFLLPEQPKWPLTFAFKTQDGDQGLLQIMGATDTPHGLKMRYKLVTR